jgi:hypothetical protein
MRRKRPRNHPQKPGSGGELEELPFPVLVPVGSGVDEEDKIKTRLEPVFVQAENFPDLPFGAVSFNGISEFLG